MISYNSIREIQKDFQINDNNLDALRERINEIRANNHPDKTHGKFENEEKETLYHKANSAITYIDSIKNNQSLAIVEKMTELMKVVTELIPNNKQNTLEQSLEFKISHSIKNYRSVFFFPKISLTAITAIVTFLFLFPNQIIDHPTLSTYIDPTNGLFAGAWLMLFSFSVFLWIIAYLNEESSKRKLSSLNVDSYQNRIFDDFLHLESERENEFTKEGLSHFIYSIGKGRREYRGHLRNNMKLLPLGREIITMEIAQSVAEIIIIRAEKNRVIRKVTYPTLNDTYEIIDYRQE